MKNKFPIILLILSVLGIAVTAYLIYQHYKPAGGSFCDISDYVSCDVVNKSKYADIFGIPVAILGFFAYFGFFILSVGLAAGWRKSKKALIPATLFAFVGFIFSLYLTAIELFVLRAICILCVTQQILIALIFIILIILCFKKQKSL